MKKTKSHKNKIYQQTVLSLLLAILIIQTFVPGLGYIPLGAIDATIVHITVILSAVLFGKKIGLFMGTAWGLLSFLRALLQPTAFNIVFLNPLISVLPRLIVGLFSAWLFIIISKKLKDRWAYVITGLMGAIMNTVLVLGAIYLFGSEAYAQAIGVPESALLGILGVVIATNGILEAVVSMILLPLLATPLSKVVKRTK